MISPFNNALPEQTAIKVITNQLKRCHNCMYVDDLLDDIRIGYKFDLKCNKYCFPSVNEFLKSIPGITLYEDGNGYFIVYDEPIETGPTSISSSYVTTDFENLQVKIDNKSYLQTNERKVKIGSAGSITNGFDHTLVAKKRYQSSNNIACIQDQSPSTKSLGPFNLTINEYLVDDDHLSNLNASVDSSYSEFSKNSNDYFALPQNSEVHRLRMADNSLLFSNYGTSSFHSPINGLDSSEAYSERNKKPSKVQIIERLVNVINMIGKTNGTSYHVVEQEYRKMHFEELPKDWLSLLLDSSLIYIENLVDDILLYPNRSFSSSPTIESLPVFEYSTNVLWNAFVCSYKDTQNLWFRLLDFKYDLKNNILRNEMIKHYNSVKDSIHSKKQNVAVGDLYAVMVDNNYLRCEVRNIQGTLASCFLLDDGVMEKFQTTDLLPLHEKFTNCPALAIRGCLSQLASFVSYNYINYEAREYLENHNVRVRIDSLSPEKESIAFITVFITNESGELNVNNVLLQLIEEFNVPVLEVNTTRHVRILSIEDKCVSVQVLSPSLELLEKSLRKAKTIIAANGIQNLRVKSKLYIKPDKIYLAPRETNDWRRVKILKQFFNGTKVSALFIDDAEVKSVNLSNILELHKFPNCLLYIQAQAVQVRVDNAEIFVIKFLNDGQTTYSFSIKVTQIEPLRAKFYVKLSQHENPVPVLSIVK